MDKIVVVGSLNYDIFVESPRRPLKGETLPAYRWYPKGGGKGGNQAISAAKNGCSVQFVGGVGNDSFADALIKNLEQYKIDVSHIEKISKTGSGMSVAIMDDEGDYGAVIVAGANFEFSNSLLEDESVWQDCKMLILQNEVSEESNLVAAKIAHEKNIPVCINAAPVRKMSDELKALIDIVVVNEVEAGFLCNLEVNNLAAAVTASKALLKDFKKVVVTAGGNGVAFASVDGEEGSEPSHKIKLVSTHGAGDCFVGALCAHLVKGNSLKDSVTYANLKAAEHVSTEHPESILK